MSRKLKAGSKVTRRHSTASGATARVIDVLERLPEVKRILLGIILSIGGNPLRIKIKIIPAGLELTVYGDGAKQSVFVYTDNANAVCKKLRASFEGCIE